MKTLILFQCLVTLLAFVNIPSVSAQTWQWSHHLGSDWNDKVEGVTDKYGNFYIAGAFYGYYFHSVTQTLSRHGDKGLFLAKYDQLGNEVWVRQFDVYDDFSNKTGIIQGVVTDREGFIYLTGYSVAKKDFGSCILPTSYGCMFVVKFTPDGTCLWTKRATGSQDVVGFGLAIDSLKNVYVCGSNESTAIFDTISVEAGGFLAKFDSTGEVLWAKRIVPMSPLTPPVAPQVIFSSMLISGNRLYANGQEYAYSITVDTATRNHPGKMGNVLCCFDLDGHLQWLKEGIATGTESGNNISIDKDGNIFICGEYFESINFDGTVLSTNSYTKCDYFLCKYSNTGIIQWARQCNTNYIANAMGVFSDSMGYSYLTGFFYGTAVFGSDTVNSVESPGDMYLARYNPDGQCMGVIHFGKAAGKSVGQDANENPVVVGTFPDSITIGQNTYINYQSGMDDIFIAKCGQITGSGEPKEAGEDRLVIYANPGDGKCTVVLPEEFRHERKLTLTIYNNQGQLLQQMPVVMDGDRVAVDISAEARGVYHAILTNGKKSFSGKIVFR